MFRRLSVVLFLIGSLNVSAWGCDTDLVALFTGEDRQDAFSQTIFRLASEARKFGTKVSSTSPEHADEFLSQLMKTWIEFDNRFSQSPPFWAKGDTRWTAKFKELANLIGEIRNEYLEERLTPTHAKTLAFSRQLMELFEGMPAPPERAALITVTRGFQTSWEAINQASPALFEDGLRELNGGASVLKTHLATPTLIVAHDFIVKIEQLQRMYQSLPGSLTPELCIHVHTAETSFRELTARLRRQGK